MSGLEQEFQDELPCEEVEGDEIVEPEASEEPEPVNPEVEKATKDGWRPKDEWAGDPDDWVSAKKFNERGEMMGTIKTTRRKMDEMHREFEDRLAQNNKLHEIQRKAMIADLESKRDNAIDLADRETAIAAQDQINDLNKAQIEDPKPDASASQSLIDDFNSKNPWIFESSPKAAYAQAQFNRYQKSGDIADALERTKADIDREFPEINPNRLAPSTTESRASRPGKRQEAKITWSQLTPDEKKFFDAGDWTKDQYLKVVADARKG
jgi:hypothetical protein